MSDSVSSAMCVLRVLRLADIRRDGGTQVRASLNSDTVDAYVETLGSLPPPDVVYDGQSYWLADGFHRVAAHMRADSERIECLVRAGTVADARMLATSEMANGRHGLPLSRADKRRAVRIALETMSEWTNTRIAEHVGVSHVFVGRVRSQMESETASDCDPTPQKRKGKDGKMYPATRETASVVQDVPSAPGSVDPVDRPIADDPPSRTKPMSERAHVRRARERDERLRPLFDKGMSDKEISKETGIPIHSVAHSKRTLGFSRPRRTGGPLSNWAASASEIEALWLARVEDERSPWKDATTEELKAAESALRAARTAITKTINTIHKEHEER